MRIIDYIQTCYLIHCQGIANQCNQPPVRVGTETCLSGLRSLVKLIQVNLEVQKAYWRCGSLIPPFKEAARSHSRY